MRNLIKKLYRVNDLCYDEILSLLSGMDDELTSELFHHADITRRRYYSDKVYIRGLVEISSYCKNTCKYCGLRRQNTSLARYRMTEDEVLDCCEAGYNLGIRTFVLQGGDDPYLTNDKIGSIISNIKGRYPDVAVTLSLGEMTRSSYQKLFDAGADRYLLRHETIERALYEELHPSMSHQNRLRCLDDLKDIGYQNGSGFIVGLKGQSDETLAQDLIYLKETSPHMIGVGPFIPHGMTPLADAPMGSVRKTLICMAMVRLLVPDVLMPVTTALSVLRPKDGLEMGLKAGANVIMLNFTPQGYREGYQIYDGKSNVGDVVGKGLVEIESNIANAGYEMNMSRGDSNRL